jgi:exonuclease SbcD
MTRFLVTGDWHLGLTTHGATCPETGKNTRHLDARASTEEIVDLARERAVDAIIHTGDIFHSCKPGVEETVTLFRFLRSCAANGIPFHGIIGNHDYSTQFGKPHALEMFQAWAASLPRDDRVVHIYSDAAWIEIGEMDMCFMPFGTGYEYDQHWMVDKADILVCHSHLEGAVVGAEPYEIRDDKATKFKDLSVRAVFAGHFHSPQGLCKNPLAFYPGSLQAVDFNERHDEKGVAIVEMDDLTSAIEFVPLATVRKLLQFDIETPHLPAGGMDAVKDAIVKVNVTLPESEVHNYKEGEIRKALENAGAHSIASINLKVDRERVVRDEKINIDSRLSSNLGRYLDLRDIGPIRSRVEQRGKQIINANTCD